MRRHATIEEKKEPVEALQNVIEFPIDKAGMIEYRRKEMTYGPFYPCHTWCWKNNRCCDRANAEDEADCATVTLHLGRAPYIHHQLAECRYGCRTRMEVYPRREIVIPVERVTDITIKGPEPAYCYRHPCSTVYVQTAGSSACEMTVLGLVDPVAFRDAVLNARSGQPQVSKTADAVMKRD